MTEKEQGTRFELFGELGLRARLRAWLSFTMCQSKNSSQNCVARFFLFSFFLLSFSSLLNTPNACLVPRMCVVHNTERVVSNFKTVRPSTICMEMEKVATLTAYDEGNQENICTETGIDAKCKHGIYRHLYSKDNARRQTNMYIL